MLIEQRYKEAVLKKQNDIRNYIWKGPKIRNSDGSYSQETKRLVDCTKEELLNYYNYCLQMLYNTNRENPGRYTLLENIKDQRNRCNSELFLRWLSRESGITRFSFMNSIRQLISKNEGISIKDLVAEDIVGSCPAEFSSIPVELLLDGCMDTLGLFYRKHLTTTFLLKQGVWPTEAEREEFKGQRMTSKFILNQLGVSDDKKNYKTNYKVRLNSKGLSFAQMKAMVSLTTKKYSEMSTLQLETLRNRILWSLENDVKFHIKEWENRKAQIASVLESKGVTDLPNEL